MRPLKKPVCAITGAGGYVGGCIKHYLQRRGWDVLELTRQPKPGSLAAVFQLGRELPVPALAGALALVHCAYDFQPVRRDDIWAVNVEGARRVLEAARAARIERVVCISSISAYDGCRSLYGKAKLDIERLALGNGALVVRPGLVYGNHPQAMFGKLVAQVRKSSVLPIFGDGSQIQYLVHNEDLAAFILRYAEGQSRPFARPLTAAHEQPWTFRELLLEIARRLNKRPHFIRLPWRLVWASLKIAEVGGLRLNFRSDSLVNLMSQNPKPDLSFNAGAGLVCRPLQIETLSL